MTNCKNCASNKFVDKVCLHCGTDYKLVPEEVSEISEKPLPTPEPNGVEEEVYLTGQVGLTAFGKISLSIIIIGVIYIIFLKLIYHTHADADTFVPVEIVSTKMVEIDSTQYLLTTSSHGITSVTPMGDGYSVYAIGSVGHNSGFNDYLSNKNKK